MNRRTPTVLILCVSSAAATAEPPSVTLEFIMPGLYDTARIAEDGRVVGVESIDKSTGAIVRFTDGRGVERIYTGETSTLTSAFVNSAGQVAYTLTTAGGMRAFLHSDGDGSVPVSPGSEQAWVSGITDAGTVYGGFGDARAAGFTYDGAFVNFPLGPDHSGFVAALSDSGHAVLQYRTVEGDRVGAVRVNPNGTSVDIGSLGGAFTYATAMNNHGDIVGNTTASDEFQHHFLFADGTGLQELDMATHSATLADINDSGWVTGTLHAPQFDGTAAFPFLWTPATGALDLNGLLPDGSGALIHNATGINNAGQIVGNATIDGQFGIYRLTVHTLPTPGALAVFAFGVALVARRRR